MNADEDGTEQLAKNFFAGIGNQDLAMMRTRAKEQTMLNQWKESQSYQQAKSPKDLMALNAFALEKLSDPKAKTVLEAGADMVRNNDTEDYRMAETINIFLIRPSDCLPAKILLRQMKLC